MNEQTLSALSDYLRDSNRFASEPSEVLEEAGYLDSFAGKPVCERCDREIADKVPSDEEGMVTYVCKGGHEFDFPQDGNIHYKLNGEAVLEDLAETIGCELTATRTRYPGYAVADINDGTRLVLVCDGANFGDILGEFFLDAITEHRVNVLFIPDSFEGEAYETAKKYPLGQLAPTFPLTMLTKPGAVADGIDSAQMALNRSEFALSKGGWEENDLYRNLDQNPKLIESELNYCRVFRETEYSGRVGDRLEAVCKAAFSLMDFSLDPETGGQDDLFENVADVAFLIPPSTQLQEDGGRILGITDTKSGSDTHLNREDIEQKHANYLRQASNPVFDDMHIAHIFVVFSMKGREANEIDWYDGIEKRYRGQNDATMVVLYADALAQMVNAHLSMAQRNELNKAIGGGITDAFRPFFNFRLFKRELGAEIQNQTRFDGDTESDKEYQREYFKRERLLVVTREMVDDRIYEVAENEEVANMLAGYPGDRW